MTSDWAITAERLGKQYLIRHQTGSSYVALRDVIADGARRAGWRLAHPQQGNRAAPAHPNREEFWALRDVSFTVQPGERVGIIGRNGAGKSTLLKVLSRITEPSAGRLGIRGRVASLLEVGTGFHPELTGRENIYLNGAVLGMGRAEIKRKFDEIVDFAEVEKFLDTPVKRYSSGMYVRLAFAVAAHLEPEILIVDEVLAVGDASFQKKCLNKMESVGQEGRTVLFVSHNMAAITRLCERAIVLGDGRILVDGTAAAAVSAYLHSDVASAAARRWADDENAPGDEVARLLGVRILSADGAALDSVDIREPIYLDVEYRHLQSELRPTAVLHFYNDQGICLFSTNDFVNRSWWNTRRTPGIVRARCHIPGNFFAEGLVSVLAAIGTYNPDRTHALARDAVSFHVTDRSEGDGSRGPYAGNFPGVLRPMLPWEVAYPTSPVQDGAMIALQEE